jgi:hypothetical protein
MQTVTHKIHRQKFQIFAKSDETAFYLRSKLHDRWDFILPVFENAFNQIDLSDSIIYIPKIELNAKVKNETELFEKLPEILANKLQEKLSVINKRESSPQENQIQWQTSTLVQSKFKNLIFYLQTGSLSWQMGKEKSGTAQANKLKEIYLEQKQQLISWIEKNKTSSQFWFRLFQMIGDHESVEILPHLRTRLPNPWSDRLIQLITTIFQIGNLYFSNYLQLNFAAYVLHSVTDLRSEMHQPDLSSLPETPVFSENKESMHNFISYLPSSVQLFFKPFIQNPPKSIDYSGNSVAETNHILTEEKTSLVSNAGLVILHPFFQRLFENTNILDPGQAEISVSSLPKAAALLYYLATGTEEIYEYELGFIKLLIGLLPSAHLLVSIGLLTKENKEEANEVLKSAIQYWCVLKNTSAEGLQSAFLARQGLLQRTDESWNLKIERKTIDLLLDKLPWGISIVKLPWMDKAICTEW